MLKRIMAVITLCAYAHPLSATLPKQTLRDQLAAAGKAAGPHSQDCSTLILHEMPKVRESNRTKLARNSLNFIRRNALTKKGFCQKSDFDTALNIFCSEYCSNNAGRICTPSCADLCSKKARTDEGIHSCTIGKGKLTYGSKISRSLRKTTLAIQKATIESLKSHANS